MNMREIRERIDRLRAGEMEQSIKFWYLSFAEDGKWLGAVMVAAHGITTALDRINDLGINPGGEVAAVPVPEGYSPPPDLLDRLLDLKDLQEAWGPVAGPEKKP